jgi:hypothetical protein
MSVAVHPPRTRDAPQQNPGPSITQRLRAAVHAGTTRLDLRQRVLVTHLAVVTLMSVGALASVLAR